jgi:hypothetical protein
LPKDNENMPSLNDGPTTDSPASSFAPDQMVRCESCLRANPPTRVNCLYCGSGLPVQPSATVLQKPLLRPLEKWEQGYNNILLTSSANTSKDCFAEIAGLLRLESEDFQRILAAAIPLPLARSGSQDEAELIQHRLKAAQLANVIVADTSLGIDPPVKLRALDFRADGLEGYRSPQAPPIKISWDDLVLLVSGRITRKRVELKEERKRSEHRVLEADQFFADESVIDLFTKHETTPYRIASGSFDFSCLAEKKRLLAAENMSILIEVLREHAPGLVYDQTYNSMRKALEAVWTSEQQNESTGWRRGRPGKYSIGSAMETSNESQFLRYSRLRYYLLTHNQISEAADVQVE